MSLTKYASQPNQHLHICPCECNFIWLGLSRLSFISAAASRFLWLVSLTTIRIKDSHTLIKNSNQKHHFSTPVHCDNPQGLRYKPHHLFQKEILFQYRIVQFLFATPCSSVTISKVSLWNEGSLHWNAVMQGPEQLHHWQWEISQGNPTTRNRNWIEMKLT